MPIPESPRIIYRHNPLSEVVCQLRFPTILRIEAELPAAFQDAIRDQYPLYREMQGAGLPENFPAEVMQLLGSVMPVSSPKVHEFGSEDQNWKLTLSKDFIALTCLSYLRWEEFRKHFTGPYSAFADLYRPAFFSRIGLRYQNVIQRSKLGLGNVGWGELLKPHIAGTLASEAAGETEEVYQQVCIQLLELSGKVTMRHGIGHVKGSSEDCYVIDNDFFCEERSKADGAVDVLDHFNRYSGRIFRWSITDKLDRAMVPEEVK